MRTDYFRNAICHILVQMEPVSHLRDIPARRSNRCGIVRGLVPADDRHLRVPIQPRLKTACSPVAEEIYDGPGLKADDDTAVCGSFAEGPPFSGKVSEILALSL